MSSTSPIPVHELAPAAVLAVDKGVKVRPK